MRPKIVVAPLSLYERHGWYCHELVMFLLGLSHERKYEVYVNPAYNVMPTTGARNLIGKMALEHKAEWLIMVDNDCAPPRNLLDMLSLVGEKMEILVPLVHIWDSKENKVKLCWRRKLDDSEIPDVSPGWKELEMAGTGCIFIKAEVLKTLTYPWFLYPANDTDDVRTGSEDGPFIQRARTAGFRVFGHTEFLCGHYRSVNLGLL